MLCYASDVLVYAPSYNTIIRNNMGKNRFSKNAQRLLAKLGKAELNDFEMITDYSFWYL